MDEIWKNINNRTRLVTQTLSEEKKFANYLTNYALDHGELQITSS